MSFERETAKRIASIERKIERFFTQELPVYSSDAPVPASRTITAGNGLIGGGSLANDITISAGAGTMIYMSADTINLASGLSENQTIITNALGIPGYVNLSDLINVGLVFADNKFSVKPGNLITVDANGVKVSNGSAQYQVMATGATPYSASWQNLSGFAGNGLVFSSGAFGVGAGTLMSVLSDTVGLANGTGSNQIIVTGVNPYTPAYKNLTDIFGNGLTFDTGSGKALLGTPSDITVSTTNNVSTTSHSHAVVSSSSPGAAASLLRTSPEGALTLASLAVTGAATVTQDFTVGANVLFVDVSQAGFGVNRTPDPQFAVDINGNLRTSGFIVGKHAIQLSGARMIAHFDGAEPYATNFTGELNGHMGQVPVTATGGLIFRPGMFGKGVQIAEATTNIVDNPRFANDLTGYIAANAATFEHVTVDAPYGTKANKVTAPYNGAFYLYLPFAASGSWSYSVYIKADSAASVGKTVTMQLRYNYVSGNPVTTYTSTHTLTNGWYRLQVSGAPAAGETTSYVQLFVRNLDASLSTFSFLVTAVQFENKAYSTPYCDGSLGSGHSWVGTAHASDSSRTASRLTYHSSVIGLDRGSFSAWVYYDGNIYNRFLLGTLGAGTNYLQIYFVFNGAAKPFADSRSNNVLCSTVTGATAMSVGWNHVVCTWETGALKVYLNGVQSGATGNYATPLGTVNNHDIGQSWGSLQINAVMDDLVILDRAMSADEVRAIYESNAPVFAETSTWSFKSTSNLVWADAEGFWTIDSSGNAAFGVSGVDTKSWGGATLDKGDILIGRSSNYVKWDASLGTLTFYNAQSPLVWEEFFNGTLADVLSRWTSYSGSGETTILSGQGSAGGNAFSIGNNAGNDMRWYINNLSIPFDSSKLYKVTARVRRTSGTGMVFFGVAGRNAADTQWVNIDGADTYADQHFIAAAGTNPGSSWTEYIGYFSGFAASGSYSAMPNPAQPGSLHTNTRYFRLAFVVNFANAAGVTDIDMIRVEVVPKTTDSPWRHTTDTTTIDGGKIYTGSVTADKITAATLSAITADMGTLTAGSIVIGSTNKLWLNDSGDGSLFIGGSVKGNAPFRVSSNGSFFSSDGSIAGWTITTDHLVKDTGTHNTSSGMAPADYPFYAGSTYAARATTAPFKVTTAGKLYATDAEITGVINANTGNLYNLNIAGTLKTAASPNPRIELTSTLFAGYSDATTKQFWIQASDGKAYAGGGVLSLSSDGVRITGSTEWNNTRSYGFTDGSGVYMGGVGAFVDVTTRTVEMRALANSTPGLVYISSEVTGTSQSTVMINASNSNGQALIRMLQGDAMHLTGVGLNVGSLGFSPGEGSIMYTGDLKRYLGGSSGTAGYIYIPLATAVTVQAGGTASDGTTFNYSQLGVPSSAKAVSVRISGTHPNVVSYGMCKGGTDFTPVVWITQNVANAFHHASGIVNTNSGSITLTTAPAGVTVNNFYLVVNGYYL